MQAAACDKHRNQPPYPAVHNACVDGFGRGAIDGCVRACGQPNVCRALARDRGFNEVSATPWLRAPHLFSLGFV